MCKQYDIPVPPFKMVDLLEGALAAAKEIGYPVVIKVVSAQILHKSDIGGVMLGIGSDSALEKSYAQLVDNVRKAAPGIGKPSVLVQKMMPAATELVLGAIRDKLFGPVVMFGLGGIYVEVLKRVGFRLAPFGIEQARALIHDTLPPQLDRRRARPQETQCRRHRRHAGLAWPVAGGAPADRRSGPQPLPGARRRLPGGGRADHPRQGQMR